MENLETGFDNIVEQVPKEIKNRLTPLSLELDIVLEVDDDDDQPKFSSWTQKKKK